ncbi:Uncharacterised protein [Acinetobacter baumannii]|nr:Uncharacterised protein [Acinetobacter baumannii]
MGPANENLFFQPSVAMRAMPPDLSGNIVAASKKNQFCKLPIKAAKTHTKIAVNAPKYPSAKPKDAKIAPETLIDRAKASVHFNVLSNNIFNSI